MKTPPVNFNLGAGGVAVLLGAGVLLWVYLGNRNAFNPVSSDNLANQGFESVAEAVTGSQDPGGDFYSATHNEDGSVKFWAAPLWFLDTAAGLPTNGIGF